jgi:hypothetical protein
MGRLGRDPLLTSANARGANRLSLLAGLTAGVVYSTFASLVANVLTPVSGRLVEFDTLSHTLSGRNHAVFSLNGVIPIVLGSLIVFGLVWWITRLTLEHRHSEPADPNSYKSTLTDALLGKPLELARTVSAGKK